MDDRDRTKEELIDELKDLRQRIVQLEGTKNDLMRTEERLSKANRTLRALSRCNEVLVHSSNEAELLDEICKIIIEEGGYRLCWVGYREYDSFKTVKSVAQAGYEVGYFKKVKITWDDSELGRGPTGTAIRSGEPYICQNIPSDPRFAPWSEDAGKRGYSSAIGLPLRGNSTTLGAITIYAAEADAFDEEEVKLLTELADNLAFGIQALRAREERMCSEDALKSSEEKYRSLVESTEDSIYLVDREYRYLFMNKRHLERMNVLKEVALGQPYQKFHSPEQNKKMVELVNRVFETGSSIQQEHLNRVDGRYFLRTLSPVTDKDGKIVAVTVVSKDITGIKQLEERLRALTLTDELTGLYNRRGFLALVEPLLKLARRQKKALYMLYADMDRLKEINDTFGHKEGDLAIRDTANIFRSTYRESDIIARIGGDEFVVIPVEGANNDSSGIETRLQEKIENHNTKGERPYKLSISCGIAHYDPGNATSIDELLLQGERLMYEQKNKKREG
ncbi:MAG TPA: diguanylate cyclase [Thermodesulfovibrionales bacterium]|nr:diguanylate cyclase [Thermodesulfovibrionales bacterium]